MNLLPEPRRATPMLFWRAGASCSTKRLPAAAAPPREPPSRLGKKLLRAGGGVTYSNNELTIAFCQLLTKLRRREGNCIFWKSPIHKEHHLESDVPVFVQLAITIILRCAMTNFKSTLILWKGLDEGWKYWGRIKTSNWVLWCNSSFIIINRFWSSFKFNYNCSRGPCPSLMRTLNGNTWPRVGVSPTSSIEVLCSGPGWVNFQALCRNSDQRKVLCIAA